MKSAGKARNNGLYRHIRTSKEIIRNLLNDFYKNKSEIESCYNFIKTPLFRNICLVICISEERCF